MDLTVLTQNLLGGAPFWSYRKRCLARVIHELAPDIISLQEVRALSPFSGESQAHELATLAGDYVVDFAPARIDADGRCEGVAVLYRHEVVERSLSALTLDATDRWDRTNPRVVLSCLLEVEGVRVHVVSTHLSLSARARARTLQELASAVADARAQKGTDLTIILGDFNASPGEEALKRLCTATHEPWVDAWAALHGERGGFTWPTPFPFRRIDYVFVQHSPRFALCECQRVPHLGSDHCALWARVRSVEDTASVSGQVCGTNA